MAAKEDPFVGLEHRVQLCLEAFMSELKTIVMEPPVDGGQTGDEAYERFRLPKVAVSYRLLLAMANLLYFRQYSVSTIERSFNSLSAGRFAKAVKRCPDDGDNNNTRMWSGL
jgi:hypothetical protein